MGTGRGKRIWTGIWIGTGIRTAPSLSGTETGTGRGTGTGMGTRRGTGAGMVPHWGMWTPWPRFPVGPMRARGDAQGHACTGTRTAPHTCGAPKPGLTPTPGTPNPPGTRPLSLCQQLQQCRHGWPRCSHVCLAHVPQQDSRGIIGWPGARTMVRWHSRRDGPGCVLVFPVLRTVSQ